MLKVLQSLEALYCNLCTVTLKIKCFWVHFFFYSEMGASGACVTPLRTMFGLISTCKSFYMLGGEGREDNPPTRYNLSPYIFRIFIINFFSLYICTKGILKLQQAAKICQVRY